MPSQNNPADLPARVKRLQILVIAVLVVGAVFLGFALIQRAPVEIKARPADEPWYQSALDRPILHAAFVIALLLLVGHFVLPAMLVESQRRRWALAKAPAAGDADKLWGLFRTRLLVSTALLGLGAVIVTAAYLQEGNVRDYLGWLGAFLLLGVLGYQYPLPPNVERWIEEQRKLLAQDRKAAGSA